MNQEQRQRLRDVAERAAARHSFPWRLQTSNSFRRIGTDRGDGEVLCAVTQRHDGHPDLHAHHDVLEFIVSANPFVVLEFLDEIERLKELEK